MATKPKKLLVIYHNPDPPEKTRMTILHHLKALEYADGDFDIHYHNVNETYQAFFVRGQFPGSPAPDLGRDWDAVILHYSFLSLRFIGWPFRRLVKDFAWINDLDCLKAAIPQDEGDQAGILDEWLLEMGVSVIFSVHYAPDRPLYPIMRDHAAIYPCLPGYIDENTVAALQGKIKPINQREWDIIYRARHLHNRYGNAGQLKSRIAEKVLPLAREKGLKANISTQPKDAIPGPMWLDFMASGKTVLGTQGGYSAVDWRGELRARVDKVMQGNPDMELEELDLYMPKGWDDYQLLTVTPRHFEAVITNTCQVLVRGGYKGVLVSDVHYIPIEPDWSNLGEVVDRIQDTPALQEMADRARRDILDSGKYTYRAFARTLEKVLEEHRQEKKNPPVKASEPDTTQMAIEAMERQLIAQRRELAALEGQLQQIQVQAVEAAIWNIYQRIRPSITKWLYRLSFAMAGVFVLFCIILFTT